MEIAIDARAWIFAEGRERAEKRKEKKRAQQIGGNEFVGLDQEEVNHRKKGFEP